LPRDFGRRKDAEKTLDFGKSLASKRFGICEEDSRRGRSMLSLSEQIRRTDFAVDTVVSDYQRLCWTGEQINADSSKQLTFCFG
jgi:hypothetical protein